MGSSGSPFAPAAIWWLLAGSAFAQTDIERLVSHDWRERNAAAAAIAALPDPDVDVVALVSVLTTEWRGPWFGQARFGGRANRRRAQDPLLRTREDAIADLTERPRSRSGPDPVGPSIGSLIVPWHPHALASFLLTSRPAIAPRVAAALRDLPLTDQRLASLWSWSGAASLDELQRRAGDGSDLALLCAELDREGERQRPLLSLALVKGSTALQLAVLRVGNPEVLANDVTRRAVVGIFLEHDDETERRYAADLLVRAGRPVTAVLRERLGRDPKADRRLLGILCALEGGAGDLGDELVPFVAGSDATSRHRALAAVAVGDVAPTARAAIARAVMPLVLEANEPTRILAIDALGTLADGVDDAMRTQLVALLESRNVGSARARLLGCLRRLGAVPVMPTSRKVEICGMVLPTTDTWLAAADDGEPAAAGLASSLAALASAPSPIDVDAVVTRLLAVAPSAVVGWLDHESPAVRLAALRALRTHREPLVSTARIARSLWDEDDRIFAAASAWLAARPDRADHAEDALAAIVRRRYPDSAKAFVASLQMPTEQLLQALSPVLRRGDNFDLVRGRERAPLRAAYEKWLADCDDEPVRQKLLAALASCGLEGEDEIAMARAALREARPTVLLNALAKASSMPSELRADVEDLIDRLLARSTDWGAGWDGLLAGDVLRKHFAR